MAEGAFIAQLHAGSGDRASCVRVIPMAPALSQVSEDQAQRRWVIYVTGAVASEQASKRAG